MKTIEPKRNEPGRANDLLSRLPAPAYARAQFTVIFALAAVTLVGVMVLGADVGVLYYNWGELQRAADAAALAGAAYLPNDAATATSTAQTYATKNGILNTDVISATAINSNSQMLVTVQRTVPYSFAKALGLTDGYVKVSATASIPPAVTTVNAGPGSPVSCSGVACTSGSVTVAAGSGASGSGTPFAGSCGSSTGQYVVMPMAIDSQTKWVSGQIGTFNQVDAKGNSSWPDAPGNWGYVSLCGGNPSGAALRSSLADGYGGELTIGNTLQAVPGKKTGPVSQGLADRSPTTLSAAPSVILPGDPRSAVLPIVNFAGCTGACSVPITGFMSVYILGVNGSAVTVQDIGIVIPNSVGSINALNDGAMGDAMLLH